MIFSHNTIKKYIEEKKIIVLPELKPEDIRPVGIRLHLGEEILIPVEGQTVDLSNIGSVEYKKMMIPTDGHILKPGDFILGTTLETYQFPTNIVGNLDGRSTFARLGLTIHQTSQIVDGNFEYPGSTVLELKNTGKFNLVLKAGIPIAMLNFMELSEPVTDTSNFKYRQQSGVLPPQGDNHE